MGDRGFVDKGVLVTGAGAGIGRGIAEAFTRQDARVAVVDLQQDRVEATVRALDGGPGRAFGVPGDVRTAEGVDRIVEEAIRHLGHVDILVNNAGVYPNCPVVDMPEDQWDDVMDTNVKGTFLMSRAAARAMIARGQGGHIVNIASGAYKSARRGAAHYCASKAGLVMFSRVLAQELAEYRIHVNVVSPGLIDVGRRGDVNPRYREALLPTIPWGRMGQPSEIADAVLFLASPSAEYLTGTVLDVDGGASAGRFFLPYSRG